MTTWHRVSNREWRVHVETPAERQSRMDREEMDRRMMSMQLAYLERFKRAAPAVGPIFGGIALDIALPPDERERFGRRP